MTRSDVDLRRSNILECTRCGNQAFERRKGWFRDADYHELLQEYFEMERRARRAEARLVNERSETDWWREHSAWTMEHLLAAIERESTLLVGLEDPR